MIYDKSEFRFHAYYYTGHAYHFLPMLKHAAREMNEIESVLMTAENGPGQLFKAVGDITKHSDISRISQMNCSKSFKQFASETKRI